MSRRPDSTVLLITQSTAYRADFVGSAAFRELGFFKTDLAGGSTLNEAVTATSQSGKPYGRRVIVFCDGLWAQVISLPSLGVRDIAPEDLQSALKYEAETLVGIDAEQAELGAVDIGSEDDHNLYWINVVEKSTWRAIADYFSTRGVKSVFLAHPAGAPNRIEELQNKTRVEFWGHSVARITPAGYLERISQSPHQAERWARELRFDSPQQAAAQAALIIGPSASTELADDHAAILNLQDETQLKKWLQMAAAGLGGRSPSGMPLIRKSKTISHGAAVWWTRAAAVLFVLTFCSAHLWWINQKTNQVVVQIIEAERPGIQKKKYDAMLQNVLQNRTDVQAQVTATRTDLQKVKFMLESQSDRMHQLLQLLVELRTSEMVIKQIAPHETGLLVSGISLNGESAPLMANRLRDRASSKGWEVHPASQKGEMKMVNGGPWTFSILLEDVGPSSLKTELQAGETLWPGTRVVTP